MVVGTRSGVGMGVGVGMRRGVRGGGVGMAGGHCSFYFSGDEDSSGGGVGIDEIAPPR